MDLVKLFNRLDYSALQLTYYLQLMSWIIMFIYFLGELNTLFVRILTYRLLSIVILTIQRLRPFQPIFLLYRSHRTHSFHFLVGYEFYCLPIQTVLNRYLKYKPTNTWNSSIFYCLTTYIIYFTFSSNLLSWTLYNLLTYS